MITDADTTARLAHRLATGRNPELPGPMSPSPLPAIRNRRYRSFSRDRRPEAGPAAVAAGGAAGSGQRAAQGPVVGGETSPGSASAGNSPDTRAREKRDTSAGPTTAADRSRGGHSFRVQVGRFVNESDAQRLKEELAGSGLSPRVVRTERDGTVVFRVQVGTYRRRENAERQIEQLKAQSYEPDLVDEAP